MDSLYDKIDIVDRFTGAKEGSVQVDQSAQADFAMDWAARQMTRPPEPEAPKPMPPIIPVAS